MNGHKCLRNVFGSPPPKDVERALSFAGYVRMNASAHRKWRNLELGGEVPVNFHHLPRLHWKRRRHTKITPEAQFFRWPLGNFPKILFRPAHHCLSSDVGLVYSDLFPFAAKQEPLYNYRLLNSSLITNIRIDNKKYNCIKILLNHLHDQLL